MRGINDQRKRRSIRNLIKNLEADLVCLMETKLSDIDQITYSACLVFVDGNGKS